MQETTTHTEPTRTQTSKKTTTRDEEGEREREREREKRSARFPSDPDWRSRLWVKTLAPCWIECSHGRHGNKRPGLGGRCKGSQCTLRSARKI